MKINTNILLQSLLTLSQLIVQFGSLVPDEYKHFVAFITTLIQALIALISHHYNPDGTNAQLPYIPPSVISKPK